MSLTGRLLPDTLEFTINVLVEDRLDLSQFDKCYNNDKIGLCAYNSKILLKTLFLASSQGIIASRKFEKPVKKT